MLVKKYRLGNFFDYQEKITSKRFFADFSKFFLIILYAGILDMGIMYINDGNLWIYPSSI